IFTKYTVNQKNIKAVFGQTVTLPCQAPKNNKSIIAAEWSRNDLGDKYLLLYWKEQFDPTNQHPSFKNRVDLQDRQMKDGDVSLILKEVTTADSGTYECRVVQRGTNMDDETISTIYLRVVAQGKTVDWSGIASLTSTERTKNIKAVVGQTVTLPCQAPKNNNSIIAAEWSRNDLGDKYLLLYWKEQFDPKKQHPSFKNRVDLQDRQMKDGDVSLILKDVTTTDSGTYECRVVQRGTNMDDDETISTIYLRVVAPGKTNHNITLEWTFTTKPDPKYIFINCDQKSSGKVHEIFSNKIQYHIRDVVEVSVSQDERFLGRVQSDKDALREGRIKLQLSRLRTEDSGMYTCRVKTDYGSGSASSELEVTSKLS
uniref:Ig-like domain-containing protein n=1 Tax=Oreochromis niloticus TaxID=8128 RepID=A0A669B8F4_ORENI